MVVGNNKMKLLYGTGNLAKLSAMRNRLEQLEMTNMNKADYNQNHNSTSINHFYEKLLLLKNMMNTETAKKMAMHRQAVMEDFLEEFMAEWEGEK